VDTAGQPTDIRVVKSLGFGLDEEAIKAVSQYRFMPAMNYKQPSQRLMRINSRQVTENRESKIVFDTICRRLRVASAQRFERLTGPLLNFFPGHAE
jgi:hypothetical protein